MKIYAVGGAVRDELLGLEVRDRDYVVVGASAEDMLALGFTPVGKDFPVFLHPETHEEYALARTERKTARGYKGFQVQASPEVTLEDDLRRRDLTINAIAKDQQGGIIDPFSGVSDLKAGILRHVSPSFTEDPVRILRIARFAARFGFRIAGETAALLRAMVASGEIEALVAERVWQELSQGLMESQPSTMFEVLRECGALAAILPEVDRLFGIPQPPQHHPEVDTGVHVMLVIDYAARRKFPLPVRFAALTHDLGKGETPPERWPAHHGHEAKSVALVRQLCARVKVPVECRDAALLAARYHGDVHRALELRPATIFSLLAAADALRRPERLEMLLQTCEADFRGRPGFESRPYPQAEYLSAALHAAAQVDGGRIAASSDSAEAIGAAVRAARICAIETFRDTARQAQSTP